jgi:molecular chaperone GrpE (heat shock protein)
MSEEAKNTVPETEQPETAPEEKTAAAAPEQAAAEAATEEDKKKDGGWFNKKAREMEAVKAKLDAAEKNAAQAKDQLLRMAAEYDNYRKRSTREADQKFGDGVSHAVEKIIPILDTLDMAANAPTTDENFKFCKENELCKLLSYKGKVFSVEIPNFIELEVTQTEPGVKGNTATNTLKPATVETGAEIRVPLFINEGDKIRIDTRTGEYMERVN